MKRILLFAFIVMTMGANAQIGPTGPTGACGPTGVNGATGPTGATGVTGINWKNTWNRSISYNLNDGVSYNGSSYVCITSNSGQEPDINLGSYWIIIASVRN